MRNIGLLEHKPFDQNLPVASAWYESAPFKVKTRGTLFLTRDNPLPGLQTQKIDLKAEALKCNSLLVTGYELAHALAVF